VVADGFQFGERKRLVLEFQLLQAQRIGFVRGQPVEHLGEAHFQGVDVPGGDFHPVSNVLILM